MTEIGKVLLVDDDETSSFISARVLKGMKVGAGISMAINGKEALERVQEEPFDLLLLDVNMPIMGGFSFLEALSNLHKTTSVHVPCIAILTSSAREEEKARATQYPMVKAFFTKPLTAEKVQAIVNLLGEKK